MCFSPEADFAAAAAITPVAAGALVSVRHRDEWPIAALPLLFAVHQLVEAFVWLGLDGSVSESVFAAATRAYLIFAQGMLPILVPVGLLLLEPVRAHRRWIVPFAAVGTIVGAYLLVVTIFEPVSATRGDHAIVYTTQTGFGFLAAAAYVVATCGPALVSTRRYLRLFGVVNILMIGLAEAVRSSSVVSLWCVAAALASVLILLHFRHQRRLDGDFGHESLEHRVMAALGH